MISAIRMDEVCEPYIRRRAVRHLEKKRVCIFAAGTGNPYFTTDTAATLRATEMGCEAIFKGTKVDGVYDKDPEKHSRCERVTTRSAMTMCSQSAWEVMDASAIALARDNNLPIIVFSLDEPGGFPGFCAGEGTYTKVGGYGYLGRKHCTSGCKRKHGVTSTCEDFELDTDDLNRRMDGAMDRIAHRVCLAEDRAGVRLDAGSCDG